MSVTLLTALNNSAIYARGYYPEGTDVLLDMQMFLYKINEVISQSNDNEIEALKVPGIDTRLGALEDVYAWYNVTATLSDTYNMTIAQYMAARALLVVATGFMVHLPAGIDSTSVPSTYAFDALHPLIVMNGKTSNTIWLIATGATAWADGSDTTGYVVLGPGEAATVFPNYYTGQWILVSGKTYADVFSV